MADQIIDDMVECVEGMFPDAKLVFSGKGDQSARTKIENGKMKLYHIHKIILHNRFRKN